MPAYFICSIRHFGCGYFLDRTSQSLPLSSPSFLGRDAVRIDSQWPSANMKFVVFLRLCRALMRLALASIIFNPSSTSAISDERFIWLMRLSGGPSISPVRARRTLRIGQRSWFMFGLPPLITVSMPLTPYQVSIRYFVLNEMRRQKKQLNSEVWLSGSGMSCPTPLSALTSCLEFMPLGQ